jgi:anhydro-N-acetylmuramic acid kinase
MVKTRIGNIPKIPVARGEHLGKELAYQGRIARRHPGNRTVVGCMTGTSIDGIDVAVITVDGDGLGMRIQLDGHTSLPLGNVAPRLRALSEQQPMSAGAIAQLGADFTQLHLVAIQEALGRKTADLVAIHGQTVFHQPPVSWQFMTPAPISWALETDVVFDLRAADLAAGGQGAPITPLADWILFRHTGEKRAIVNLGGFCNITQLPAHDEIRHLAGGDVCACNQILDRMARALLDVPYDRDGLVAQQGKVIPAACADLVKLLENQADAGRSLGTGDELGNWSERHEMENVEDALRTACAAIATVIVNKAGLAQRIVLGGGGVRNKALVGEIRQKSSVPVVLTDDLGIPATLREAIAIAVLGALCQDGVPITVPKITGVDKAPLSGTWIHFAAP